MKHLSPRRRMIRELYRVMILADEAERCFDTTARKIADSRSGDPRFDYVRFMADVWFASEIAYPRRLR